MIKMYYSREDRLGDIFNENERAQYQKPGEDYQKASDTLEALDESLDDLYEQLIQYFTAVEARDNDPQNIAFKRAEMVEGWSKAQAILSKFAYVLRIDGNDAYQRLINAIKEGNAVDMTGL